MGTAGLIAVAAILVLPLLGPALDEPAVPILIIGTAGYAAARYRDDWRGLVVPAVPFLGVLVIGAVSDTAPDVSDVVFTAIICFPPYAAGRLVTAMLDRNRLLAQETALIAASREAAIGEAVAAERSRMARELHDVIAHSLSVMTVQAAAAEDQVEVDPAAARAAMQSVQQVGRSALGETGELLRLLRDADDELGLAPERGLADVDALIAQFRSGGLEVAATFSGDLSDLPPMVSASAFRVLRELLTNALRHAADQRVSVTIERTPHELRIAAVNAATANAEPESRIGGLGLVGVGERVAVHGGELTQLHDGDLFTVSASIPLAEVAR
jgi:signal transduction histidine kinase